MRMSLKSSWKLKSKSFRCQSLHSLFPSLILYFALTISLSLSQAFSLVITHPRALFLFPPPLTHTETQTRCCLPPQASCHQIQVTQWGQLGSRCQVREMESKMCVEMYNMANTDRAVLPENRTGSLMKALALVLGYTPR